jgi:hypothetical protein
MIEKFLGIMLGYWAAKFLDGLFGPSTGPAPAGLVPNPLAAPSPTTIKDGQRPAQIPSGAIPVVSPGAIPAPEVMPLNLPPFPSGWTYSKTTPAVVQRAWQLLPLLAMGQVKYETAPDAPTHWLAYRKEPHAQGKTGVTVYTPRYAPPPAPPGPPGAPGVATIPNAPAASQTPVYSSAPAPGQTPGAGVVRNLRRGMKGPDVAAWQRKLGLTDDGDFGKGTLAATMAFQRKHGLPADGVVGPDTRAAANVVSS